MAAVLFICTANICRSPMAEAVFKSRLAGFGNGAAAVFKTVQSAGVHADPRGGPVDARAAATLSRHNYSLEKRWRSRRVQPADLDQFDLILAMEAEHVEALTAKATAEQAAKVKLLLDFAPGREGQELPDPYFGPAAGFDAVLGMIEQAVQGIGAAWRDGRLALR